MGSLLKMFWIVMCMLFFENEALADVRGTEGVDYPNYLSIPKTSFKCSDQQHIPGFYADLETNCQVFHYCYEHRQESFLCPTGTIFNQAIKSCDYWYSSDCGSAPASYSSNSIEENHSGYNDQPLIPAVNPSNNIFEKMAALYDPSENSENEVVISTEKVVKNDNEHLHIEDPSKNHNEILRNDSSLIPLNDVNGIEQIESKDLNYIKYEHDTADNEDVDIILSGEEEYSNWENEENLAYLGMDNLYNDAGFSVHDVSHRPRGDSNLQISIAEKEHSDEMENPKYSKDEQFEQLSSVYPDSFKDPNYLSEDAFNSMTVLSKRLSDDETVPKKKKLRRKPKYVVLQTEELAETSPPRKDSIQKTTGIVDRTNTLVTYTEDLEKSSANFYRTDTELVKLPAGQSKRNRKPLNISNGYTTDIPNKHLEPNKEDIDAVMPVNIMTAYESEADTTKSTLKQTRRKPILIEDVVFDTTATNSYAEETVSTQEINFRNSIVNANESEADALKWALKQTRRKPILIEDVTNSFTEEMASTQETNLSDAYERFHNMEIKFSDTEGSSRSLESKSGAKEEDLTNLDGLSQHASINNISSSEYSNMGGSYSVSNPTLIHEENNMPDIHEPDVDHIDQVLLPDRNENVQYIYETESVSSNLNSNNGRTDENENHDGVTFVVSTHEAFAENEELSNIAIEDISTSSSTEEIVTLASTYDNEPHDELNENQWIVLKSDEFTTELESTQASGVTEDYLFSQTDTNLADMYNSDSDESETHNSDERAAAKALNSLVSTENPEISESILYEDNQKYSSLYHNFESINAEPSDTFLKVSNDVINNEKDMYSELVENNMPDENVLYEDNQKYSSLYQNFESINAEPSDTFLKVSNDVINNEKDMYSELVENNAPDGVNYYLEENAGYSQSESEANGNNGAEEVEMLDVEQDNDKFHFQLSQLSDHIDASNLDLPEQFVNNYEIVNILSDDEKEKSGDELSDMRDIDSDNLGNSFVSEAAEYAFTPQTAIDSHAAPEIPSHLKVPMEYMDIFEENSDFTSSNDNLEKQAAEEALVVYDLPSHYEDLQSSDKLRNEEALDNIPNSKQQADLIDSSTFPVQNSKSISSFEQQSTVIPDETTEAGTIYTNLQEYEIKPVDSEDSESEGVEDIDTHIDLQSIDDSELSEVVDGFDVKVHGNGIDETYKSENPTEVSKFQLSSIPLPANSYERDFYVQNLKDIQQEQDTDLQSNGVYSSTFYKELSPLPQKPTNVKFPSRRDVQKAEITNLKSGLFRIIKSDFSIKQPSPLNANGPSSKIFGNFFSFPYFGPYQSVQSSLYKYFPSHLTDLRNVGDFSARTGKLFKPSKIFKLLNFGKKLLAAKRAKLNMLKKFMESYNLRNNV